MRSYTSNCCCCRKEEGYHCIDSSKEKFGLVFTKQFGFRREQFSQSTSSVEIIYVMYLEEKNNAFVTEIYTISFNDSIEFEFGVICSFEFLI